MLRRGVPSKPSFTTADRLLFVWPYRLFPSVLNAGTIVQPETIIRWHRVGFRLYWRWKSRSRGGRPKVLIEIRRLIREMSLANRLWGAPRIHGELLKIGIEVAQSTVRDYPTTRRSPWQNGHAERLIGSICRECLDHIPTRSRCCALSSRVSTGCRLIVSWG